MALKAEITCLRLRIFLANSAGHDLLHTKKQLIERFAIFPPINNAKNDKNGISDKILQFIAWF